MIPAHIDAFASLLLEEAKRFLEKAKDADAGDTAHSANLHASLMLAFCALEAHINAVAEEFADRPELSQHEKSLLLEKEIVLEHGKYAIKPGLRVYRLEDRIYFLHQKFAGKLDPHASWKGQLGAALKFRNSLTHPKIVPQITPSKVAEAIGAVIGTIDALYKAIYKLPLPSAARGLQSKLDF